MGGLAAGGLACLLTHLRLLGRGEALLGLRGQPLHLQVDFERLQKIAVKALLRVECREKVIESDVGALIGVVELHVPEGPERPEDLPHKHGSAWRLHSTYLDEILLSEGVSRLVGVLLCALLRSSVHQYFDDQHWVVERKVLARGGSAWARRGTYMFEECLAEP